MQRTSLFLLFVLFLTIKPESMQNLANPKTVTIRDKKFKESIPYKTIQHRVKELGKQITQDYSGKKLVVIGVLNGAAIFTSDLVREIDVDCQIDFLKVSSYGNATRSSGTLQFTKDISTDITDCDVVLVEDIIESGLTISFVREHLLQKNPRSISIATLLHKNLCQLDFPIEYVGFNIPELFVIGYGLDYAQSARNLKSIYVLDEE